MSVPWRWNIGFAAFGAVLIFLISLSSNPPLTSLVRSLYAFIAFGLLGLFVRIVLQQLLRPARTLGGDKERAEEERGIVLDMTTPEDDESLSLLMKEQWTGKEEPQSAGFQPLKPPKLVSIEDEPDPEQVAQAIRRLNDD